MKLIPQKILEHIYLFWVALTLFSCGKQGLLFIDLHVFFIEVASLVVEHRLLAHSLSSCGTWL